MAHIPGHAPGGFAPEFQSGTLLQNIQAGIEPARRRQELRLGQLSRTRQLSPSQEAFVISQGQQEQQRSLVNARLRGDLARAQQEQRERLIQEGREFQVEEEQRQFRRNQALAEQQQRQGLLGSIFGNIAGIGGRLLGGAIGGPIGAVAGGALGGGGGGGGGLPPVQTPNLAQDVGGFTQGLSF